MRWVFLIIGAVATAAMLGISMRLNFLFGYSLGQTPEKALVFGWVSVISDAWKGLGPIFVRELFRAGRGWSAAGAASIWSVCFVYSVTSALGVAIEDRSNRTGSRETIVMNYEETVAEAKRLKEKRKGLRAHRPAPELEAAINALLLSPVESYQRIRGTIAGVSNNCQRPDTRTAEACARVARLREEFAVANEERDLDRRLSELTGQVQQLRERGAMKAADPQAELFARLSGGRLSPDDIGPGLSLLLAVTIELVSAFGPAVLSSYWEATACDDGKPRGKATGLVIDYLADCVEPATNTDMLSESALYTGYVAWCRASGLAAVSAGEFVTGFDQLRAENGLAKIRKRKGGYCGIRLALSHETLATN
jgi:hypothetical protein